MMIARPVLAILLAATTLASASAAEQRAAAGPAAPFEVLATTGTPRLTMSKVAIEALGVTYETARTELKRVFAKTDVSR
jgi:hypothetical protein